MIEAELIDDYLRENLSATERASFTENYLTNANRRANLHSAENLWRASRAEVSAVNLSQPFAPQTFWQNLFASWQRPLITGTAAAILLIGIIAGWILTKKAPEIARQPPIEEFSAPVVKTDSQALPANTASETPVFNVLPSAAHSEIKRKSERPSKNAAPKTAVPPSSPKNSSLLKKQASNVSTSQSFTLAPGITRGEGEQFINISRAAKNISLHLELPKEAAKYQNYRAILKDADGRLIRVSPKLKRLHISIRAAEFENRTYIIFLEGENAPNAAEPVTEYIFRAVRPKK